MSTVLEKYEKYPDEVQPAVQQLRLTIDRVVREASVECKEAGVSDDVAKMDAVIFRYAESGDLLLDEMISLKAQRKSMQDILISKLISRKSSTDVQDIQASLKEAQPFESDE
eukprot:SAG11_NODE_27316_length_334_cov_0.651064_1_plen_111_part_11